MKNLTKFLCILIFLFAFVINANAFKKHERETNKEIEKILIELSIELKKSKEYYYYLKQDIYEQINIVKSNLATEKNLEIKVNLLIEKDQLNEKLALLVASEMSTISKIRYLKGLSIIKILYEKILSLDHHFSSIATFNEISKISNPNNYQEFAQVKDVVKSKLDKKKGLSLTNLLGQNIYTSSIDMLLGLFNSDASLQEKELELRKVECIMDFTLRMNNDLNTIYFETSFLQKSNDKIMQDLERLFVDYTKPIKYHIALRECRANDNWEVVKDNLSTYLLELDNAITDSGKQAEVQRMQIDLNFPIDRLLQFITQYNSFIDQGGKFYEKFKIILDSYENEQQCSSSLPPAYIKLKTDIDIAIEKFNTAYKPVEINGSKMKEILYGINEYD